MKDNNTDIFDRIMSMRILSPFRNFYIKQKSKLLYLFFGALTTFVSIGVFILCNSILYLDVLFANILSWICAVLFAYVTNRRWVFESKSANVGKEIVSFFVGRLFTLAIEEIVLVIFVNILFCNATLIKCFAQVVVLVLNYVVSKLFVFKEKLR